MQDMKFKIESLEQSEALQKVLFEQGYHTLNNRSIPLTHTFIFTYIDGEITWLNVENSHYYNTHGNEEMNTSQYITEHSIVDHLEKTSARNKYSREISPGVWVDVYDVLNAWTVTDPCLQHLIKKALAVGQRGHKDAETDYKDILASSKRALEIFHVWKENP